MSPTHRVPYSDMEDECQQFPTDLSFKPTSSPSVLPSARHSQEHGDGDSAQNGFYSSRDVEDTVQNGLYYNKDGDAVQQGLFSKVDTAQQGGLYSKLLTVPDGEEKVRSEPQTSQPRKRPSDFSTAFLLSHQPAHTKRPRSAEDSYRDLPERSGRDNSSQDKDYTQERDRVPGIEASKRSPVTPSFHSGALPVSWEGYHHLPPSAFSLSAPNMLLSQQASLLSALHGRNRERSTSLTSASSLEPISPVGHHDFARCLPPSPEHLPHVFATDDVPSAFRRNDRSDVIRPRHDASRLLSSSSASSFSEDRSPEAPRGTKPVRGGVSVTSPVLTSPYDLLVPRAGEVRRGTSTSPAHSERTSSGCGSPPQADSPSHSPTHHPHRYPAPADMAAWNAASNSSASSSLSPNSRSSLPFMPPMGLRYLPPGLPYPPGLGKGLPLSLPFSPKDIASSLAASAALSTSSSRAPPPFLHPGAAAAAAAAYYSSLRTSLSLPPFPFPFPGDASVDSKTSPRGAEAAGDVKEAELLLRQRMHKPSSPYESQSSAFQSGAPHRGVSPIAAGFPHHSHNNPRPSPASLSPVAMTSPVPGLGPDPRLSPRAGLLGGGRVGLVGGPPKGRSKEQQEAVRYNCDDCSKSYSTHSGLSKHKQFHCTAQVKKEFSCKYCEKSYTSLGALKMHIRTHTLPCKCTVCGKAFSRPWLLQGHVRTHTGEKPFSCQHCQRAFADRSNLRAHLQTHSHVKKYSCQHCHKTFSRMSLLLKHEDQCRTNGAA